MAVLVSINCAWHVNMYIKMIYAGWANINPQGSIRAHNLPWREPLGDPVAPNLLKARELLCVWGERQASLSRSVRAKKYKA